jgi:pimeloyl-ACP methyl ester carboxylesterase
MKNWSYPYEVNTQKLNEKVELAYIDEGSGTDVLLFIHGLGSNLKAWIKNIEGLKHSYRCIAIDLPGYGKSSKKDYTFSMSFFAESVLQLLDQLNIEAVTLVGHSMGGQVAVKAALMNASRISKLVLVAPAGFETFNTREQKWVKKTVTPKIIRMLSTRQLIINFKLNFFHFPEDAQFMIDDRLMMRNVVAEYEYFSKMVPKCIDGMFKEPIFPFLSQIHLPTLVLFGLDDQLIPNRFLHGKQTPESVAKRGSAKISNHVLHLLPRTGHFVQWEQPYVVNSTIAAFLEG